jgi:hypothetical protein
MKSVDRSVTQLFRNFFLHDVRVQNYPIHHSTRQVFFQPHGKVLRERERDSASVCSSVLEERESEGSSHIQAQVDRAIGSIEWIDHRVHHDSFHHREEWSGAARNTPRKNFYHTLFFGFNTSPLSSSSYHTILGSATTKSTVVKCNGEPHYIVAHHRVGVIPGEGVCLCLCVCNHIQTLFFLGKEGSNTLGSVCV